MADYIANDGWIGGGVGWIILLFIFILGVGGNGFFGNGNGGNALTQAELQAGLYNQTVDRNLSDIRSQICESTMALNNAITQGNYQTLLGFKDLSSQLAECCCNIRAQLLQDKYDASQSELMLSRIVASNQTQTQNLLGSIGRFVANPPVSPCAGYGYPYYSTGTTIV